MTIDWMEIEDLAAYICGLGDDYESDAVEEAIYKRFEISLEQFHEIVEVLAPMAISSKSALTDSIYSGFADKEHGFFLAKVEQIK